MPALPFDGTRALLAKLFRPDSQTPVTDTPDESPIVEGDISAFAASDGEMRTTYFQDGQRRFALTVSLSDEQQQKRLAYLASRARHRTSGLAQNSRRGLASDWLNWLAFCAHFERQVLPTQFDDLRDFIDILIHGERKRATIEHHLWTITKINSRYGCPNPMSSEVAREYWRDRLREDLTSHQKQATALNYEDVTTLAEAVDHARAAPKTRRVSPVRKAAAIEAQRRRLLRDTALIHVVYDLLARADELVRMKWHDVSEDANGGGAYHLQKSKTDQEGRGQSRYLRPATMAALTAWRQVAGPGSYIFHGVKETPMLSHGGEPRNEVERTELELMQEKASAVECSHLSTRDVTNILRKAAALAGNPLADYSGHSARVGATQDMVLAGATTEEIKLAGGWKSDQMPSRYAAKALAQVQGESRFEKIEKLAARRKKKESGN